MNSSVERSGKRSKDAFLNGGNSILTESVVSSLQPPRGYGCSPNVAGPAERSRFSNLLLEFGERQLHDWAAVASSTSALYHSNHNYHSQSKGSMTASSAAAFARESHFENGHPHHRRPTATENAMQSVATSSSFTMRRIDGRLRLCSLSLVFEPNDWSRGIIRCPIKFCDAPPSLSEEQEDTVVVKCSRHCIMKAGNIIAPYDTIEKDTIFRFTFLHSSPQQFLQVATLLFNNGPMSSNLTDQIIPFDASNFIDVREKALTTNLRCSKITPLLSTSGCLVVTNSYIYFQPCTSAILSAQNTTATIAPKATPWALSSISGYGRRYSGLKDSALELFLSDNNTNSSVLLAFETPEDRERVLRLLPTHVPCHTDREFVVACCKQWVKDATLSNYDYLLALNSSAARSFHDLSRYPVFPWVIKDYKSTKLDLTKPSTFRDLSKPVGALDENRLEYFQTRFESMQQDMTHPFLYGTHYSAPGYVLYYLVRSMPEHMLCLQNGKFDSPDRMFHSLEHSYASVLTNHADVKELIPEFFDVGNSGFDFLINARNLNLGITQTGERLHDVILPPWAKSARDFVRKNRKALESEYATLHLPKWIDLIFGAKSRGDKALKASNLFHKMAYLGPTDLSRMATEEDRAQAELQATEFGIVPDQLFTSEHPMKQLYNNNVITSVESVVNIYMSRRDEFPDLSYDYVTNAHEDTSPLVAADHPWELLDSPSKSMKSFDELGDSSELGLNSTILHPKILPTSGPDKKNTAVFEGDGKSEYPKLGDSTPKRTAKTSWLSRNLVRRKGSEDVVLVGEEHLIDGDPQSPQHGLTSLDVKTSNVRNPFASGEEDQGAIGSPTECFMKQLAVKVLHADTVSSCALLHQQGVSYLISCGLDGNFIVQIVACTESRTDIVQNPQSKLRILSRTLSRANSQSASSDTQYPQDGVKLSSFRSHSGHGPISCMVLGSDFNCGPVAFTGGFDDSIVVYGVKTAEGLASLNSHTDAVTGLHIIPIDRSRSPSFQNIVPESATHFLTSCSWDGTVKVWSVRCEFSALDYDEEEVSIMRDPLIEFYDANTPVVCVSSTYTESGILIAAGCNDGSVFIWLCSIDGEKCVIHEERSKRGSGPCSAVVWREISDEVASSLIVGSHILIAGFAAGKVSSFIYYERKISPISEVSVGSPVRCMALVDDSVIVGCSDGGLRVISVEKLAFFDSKPKLWKSVNGKNSPGLSSVSISSFMTGISGTREKKRWCVTGADDGSVALFEVKC